MATLEIECTNPECGWVDFRNSAPALCPRCGAPVRTFWDEAPDYEENDDAEDGS